MDTNSQKTFVSFHVSSNRFHFLHSTGCLQWLNMLHSTTSTTAAQKNECYLMHLRNQEMLAQIPKQTVSTYSLSASCQPTISTPSSTVPPVPWRFLTLFLSTPVPNCQANQTASNSSSKVTSQCKRPSSPTVPAHYRTSGVQLLTSYLQTTWISHSIHVAIHFFHEPRSLTKH